MTVIIKLPNQDEYLNMKLIAGYRIAKPDDKFPGHKVFIDIVIGNNIRYRWVQFRTKKSAQNFCAKLKRSMDAAHG